MQHVHCRPFPIQTYNHQGLLKSLRFYYYIYLHHLQPNMETNHQQYQQDCISFANKHQSHSFYSQKHHQQLSLYLLKRLLNLYLSNQHRQQIAYCFESQSTFSSFGLLAYHSLLHLSALLYHYSSNCQNQYQKTLPCYQLQNRTHLY